MLSILGYTLFKHVETLWEKMRDNPDIPVFKNLTLFRKRRFDYVIDKNSSYTKY